MAFPRPIATTRSATGIPTGKLAVWWLIGSEIVIFGGLLACYVALRLFHDDWAVEAAATNTWLGATNTFILLTSSFTAVCAHHYAEKKDTNKAFIFLWLTILGAVMFLCVKYYEWTHEIAMGFTWHKSLFWGFYYTAAGIHALHVIGGAIIMAIVSFINVRKGTDLHRVELCGLYWHFVDIVWIFLFPLLYIAK